MQITHWVEGPDDFPIAQFKAKYNGEIEGYFEKYDHLADLAVTTAQSCVKRKSDKQKAQFWGFLFTSTICLANFQSVCYTWLESS